MFLNRSITSSVLITALALGAGAAVMAPSEASAGKDCSGTAKNGKVKAACKAGGLKAAKKLMKAAVKKAKADGKKWKCKTCHDDTKKYTAKSGAPEGIEKYL